MPRTKMGYIYIIQMTTNLNSENMSNTTETLIQHKNNNSLDNIKILTHNIQGVNDKLKMQIWLEYCYKNNFNIISMTETKLAESTHTKFKLSNSYYNIYTSNCTSKIAKKQESSMGTAIAVSKLLQPYIHNIITLEGTALAIDFFFPQNQKIRIISVYLPSNNKTLSNNTQQEIVQWITYSHTHNYNTIVLGDFNYDRRKHKAQPTLQLFTTMKAHGMNSLLDYFDINLPTWVRGPLHSQIDDIWISNTLTPNMDQPEIISTELITDSDHKIITTTWQTNTSIRNYRPKTRKRTIFLYNKMTQDDWTDFKNDINKNIKKKANKLAQMIITEEDLNKSWNILNQAIRQAANDNIPKTKTCPKLHYACSKKATKLHAALQKINQIITHLKRNNLDTVSMTTQEINDNIDKINNYTGIQLPKLNHIQNANTTLEDIIKLLKHQQKMIYQIQKIENNMAHKQKIQSNIAKRHNNFSTNTSKMINSILQRHTDSVILNNITHPSEIIVEPKAIKKEIKEHFKR